MADDLADAMSRIDDEFVGLEALTLGRDLLFFLDLRAAGVASPRVRQALGTRQAPWEGGSGSGPRSAALGVTAAADGVLRQQQVLEASRFRGGFGSLFRHCASFVLGGLWQPSRPSVSTDSLRGFRHGLGDFLGLPFGKRGTREAYSFYAFSVTQLCARKLPRPCLIVSREPEGAKNEACRGSALRMCPYSTFRKNQ